MYFIFINVILSYSLLFVSGYAVSEKADDIPDLKWGSKYRLEGERLSLTGGWVEDFKYWRTKNASRLDFYKGADKTISIKGRKMSSFKYGVQYNIHPETTEEYENKLVCTQKNGDIFDKVHLVKILPDPSDFEYLGYESKTRNIHKFKYEYSSESRGQKEVKIIFAQLNKNTTTWIPIKFEETTYNAWLGSLSEHMVWHFYNYGTDVNDDVFKVNEFGCDNPKNSSRINNESITKYLMSVNPDHPEHVDHVFTAFMQKHSKMYEDEREKEIRRNIFQKNMRHIIAHNRINTQYKLGITKFADRTPEELKTMNGLLRRKEGDLGTEPFGYSSSQIKEISAGLPKDFDHRLYGRMTPVKDQEDCGSCWTFGTTSAMEGALAIKNGGTLVRLSNQALIDCAWGFGAYGCDGGSDTAAYKWMMKYGLPTEEEYGPYANKDGFCHIGNMTTTYKIRGFVDVTPFSVEALKVALVNHGPLSVSISITHELSLYTGGIFYDSSCKITMLDHEVTLVGYGQKDGEEYWIIKNSWGTDWGIDGYLHISTRDNSCGITVEPTYVVL